MDKVYGERDGWERPGNPPEVAPQPKPQRKACRRARPAAGPERGRPGTLARANRHPAEIILDVLPDATLLWGEEERLRYANPAFFKLFPDLTAQDALGGDFESLQARLFAQDGGAWAAARLGARNGRCIGLDQALADGRILHLTEKPDGQGGVVTVIADVTEVRGQALALAEWGGRNRQLAAAVEAAPIGVAVTDPTRPGNPVMFVNPAFTRITGFGPGEILGRPLTALHGPETEAVAVAALDHAVAARVPAHLEILSYRKDGHPFWNRVQIAPVFDQAGRIESCVALLMDITARRFAEDALRESEERFRAIAKAVPMAMVILRQSDGVILHANHRAAELLGQPIRRLIGRAGWDWCVDRAVCARLAARFGKNGHIRGAEFRLRRADGSAVWVLASAEPAQLKGQNAVLALLLDSTEIKRKETELREAKEAAERAHAAKARFFAAASHDLRQPMQALALFTAALSGRVRGEPAEDILGSMKLALRSMSEMFDSLLDMSRLDAGALNPVFEDFPFQTLLDRLEAEFRPQAQAKGLRLILPHSRRAVHSDQRLLLRILRNLLGNALRYTPRGRVLVGCRRRGDFLAVEVWDTGIGIPRAQCHQVFEEFYQVQGRRGGDAAGQDKGLGLGLAIVERLSRLLGAQVSVTSREGRGSMFRVLVPLAHEAVADPAPAAPEPSAALAGRTIAIVDTDVQMRDALTLTLEGWGCRTVAARDFTGLQLRLAALGWRPDLGIVDLHLGSRVLCIDTLATAASRLGAGIPLVVLSGQGGRAALPAPPGVTVLEKPVVPERLLPAMLRALDKAAGK